MNAKNMQPQFTAKSSLITTRNAINDGCFRTQSLHCNTWPIFHGCAARWPVQGGCVGYGVRRWLLCTTEMISPNRAKNACRRGIFRARGPNSAREPSLQPVAWDLTPPPRQPGKQNSWIWCQK